MKQTKNAPLGCPLRTPLTHSPIKAAMLDAYAQDLVSRAGELIIAELSKAESHVDLNLRALDTSDSGLKKRLTDLIVEGPGTCKELKSFAKLVTTYCDPLALLALEQKKLTTRGIAEKMADHIVNHTAEQLRVKEQKATSLSLSLVCSDMSRAIQADSSEIDTFYRAQLLVSSNIRTGQRNIFAANTSMGQAAEKIGSILATYPTPSKLYRTVVGNALIDNQLLLSQLQGTVHNAVPSNQRQRLASQYAKVGPHYSSSSTATGGDGASSEHYHGGQHEHHHEHHHHHHHHHHERDGEDGHKHGHKHGRHHHRGHRHEAHVTSAEATQAQIRGYICAGMVPPQFEPFAPVAASTSSSSGATQRKELFKNVAVEAPSLEAVAVGKKAPAPAASKIGSKAEAASLEPIASKPAARTAPAIKPEPPSLEPNPEVKVARAPVAGSVAVAQKRTAPSGNRPITSLMPEAPSLEKVASRPPALQYVSKKQPVAGVASPMLAVPSLEDMIREAE